MKRSVIAMVTAAALVALGACKNGSNNARDTTGLSAPAAATPAAAPAAAGAPDSTYKSDSAKKAATRP